MGLLEVRSPYKLPEFLHPPDLLQLVIHSTALRYPAITLSPGKFLFQYNSETGVMHVNSLLQDFVIKYKKNDVDHVLFHAAKWNENFLRPMV